MTPTPRNIKIPINGIEMILLWYNNKYNKYVCTVDIYIYIYIYIRLTIKPNSVRIISVALRFVFFTRRDDYRSPA